LHQSEPGLAGLATNSWMLNQSETRMKSGNPPQLHWLPVRHRVEFKIATLVYLSLSSIAPACLAADCQLVSDEGHRLLRSATSRTCVVRRTYSNYGDRCFAATGPRLWNSLPADLRQADISFEQFKRLLKTFLFGCWDHGAL